MKRLVRRFWPIMLGVFLVAIAGGGWLWWAAPDVGVSHAQDPPPPEEYADLDPIEASRIAGLRNDLGLDDDALVGLNLTADQAEDVLALVREEALDEHETIHARKVAIAEKEGALRAARRKIRIGPRDETLIASIPTLKADIATAEAQYETLLAGVRTRMNSLLSETQQSTWAALRANTGMRMPDRLLSLSDEERRELKRARRHYRRRLAQASDATERAAAKSTYESDRDDVLDATDDQVLAAYHTSAGDASERVVFAVDTVLPVEAEVAGP